MTGKRFAILTLSLLLLGLLLLGGLTAWVDPLFHYHAPLDAFQYPIINQRYQNDGILRHFDYDAILTGTSMTENFSATEFNILFGVSSVKTPLNGSMLRETRDRLDRALSSNPEVRYVVRSLDFYALAAQKDKLSDFAYPDYLYDDNLLNDVRYVFNKSVLFDYTREVFRFSQTGLPTTSFDEFSSWSDYHTYGKARVLQSYTRYGKSGSNAVLSDADIARIRENIQANVVELARNYPDTQFYVFFPPYSICTWDQWNQAGTLQSGIETLQTATEELLGYENIHIFSFSDDYDMICDLDNYKDLEHYGKWINSHILQCMKEGRHELTQDNYLAHFDALREFYSAYDYDSIYAE